jgi:hypothetical protein
VANNLKLQLEIAASGAGATVAELLNVRKAIDPNAVSAQFATVPKKKTCKTGISCGGTCISANKVCRSALSEGQKQQKPPIVASAGVAAKGGKKKPEPNLKINSALQDALQGLSNTIDQSTVVPVDVAKAKTKSKVEAQPNDASKESNSNSKGLESNLIAMSEGANPDDIQISDKDIKHARSEFIGGNSDSVKGNKMQAEAKNISDDEALALSTWIGSSYSSMNKILYGGELDKGVDRKAVEITDLLAAKALHKLAPVTEQQVKREAKKKGAKFSAKKPLGRYMEVDNPEEFVKKYQEALKGDGLISEGTFFATSHIPREDFGFCSMSTNLTYEVKPKLDGKGSGRYIDHYKHHTSEGEILYPPHSKFRVVGVIAPKIEKKEFKLLKLSKQELQHQKDALDLIHSEKIAFVKVQNLTGVSLNTELAKAYKKITGKNLPSKAKLDEIKAKGEVVNQKAAANLKTNNKNFKASNGTNRNNNWIVQLEEI